MRRRPDGTGPPVRLSSCLPRRTIFRAATPRSFRSFLQTGFCIWSNFNFVAHQVNEVDLVRRVAPGPLRTRLVTADAILFVASLNTSYRIFHELVQPFNFSIDAGNQISLLVPSYAEAQTAAGYGAISYCLPHIQHAQPQNHSHSTFFFPSSLYTA